MQRYPLVTKRPHLPSSKSEILDPCNMYSAQSLLITTYHNPCCSCRIVRSAPSAENIVVLPEKSPPKAGVSQKDEHVQESQKTGPEEVGEKTCKQLIAELDALSANQAMLTAHNTT